LTPRTFVIVGAGLAGGSAAATLREEGFDDRVVLIGAEPHPPYERPPLSKEYFRGEQPFEAALVRPADFYVENDIETRFGIDVVHVDPLHGAVDLSDGDRVPYNKLLLATGSRNRRIPLPGLDLQGVYDLRTVDDCDRIREEAVASRRAAMIGMGFIGSEVAASLRQLEVEVTAIEGSSVPLQKVLGPEIGGVLKDIHSDQGVNLIFEDHVVRFEGGSRVERVVTQAGRSIDCDFALVGVGVEPVVDAVAEAGIEIDNGILVDEYCRTTVDGIFAAGDVANHYHPVFGERMRVEHWHNALNQGPAAARNMLDKNLPYDEIPWFWSDQYEYNLQYAGFHREWDEIVVRGNLVERDFIAFYIKDGLVAASVGIDRGRDVRRAQGLIKARKAVNPALLRDEEVDLRTLTA
jgi:3-phenylpropionate/trans-cinnamate dioxygenase ferredoxin reductase subunit